MECQKRKLDKVYAIVFVDATHFTDYQRCIVHQIRSSMKTVSYKDRKKLDADLKEVYVTSNEKLGYELFKIDEKWSLKYPTYIKSLFDNWDKLNTFFKFLPQIMKIMYTTRTIESLNGRYQFLNKKRVVFPTYDTLLKVVYLTTLKVGSKWTYRKDNWDFIIKQFRIMYDNRI